MEEKNIFSLDVKERVDGIVYEAMNIYMNKLKYGAVEVGLEATFQHYLSNVIENLLSLHTYDPHESFKVLLEKNVAGKNEKKNYIDIVIKYKNHEEEQLFLIELKFKKTNQGAENEGVIDSYKDMYNLSMLCDEKDNVKGCYFIFLTDKETYVNESKSGTRKELPMFDGAIIQSNRNYIPTKNGALERMKSYPDGFKFSSNHTIEYKKTETLKGENYWHFIEKFQCDINDAIIERDTTIEEKGISQKKDEIISNINAAIDKEFGDDAYFNSMCLNSYFNRYCKKDSKLYLKNIKLFKFVYDKFGKDGKIYLNNRIVSGLVNSAYDDYSETKNKEYFQIDERKFSQGQVDFLNECIKRAKKNNKDANINDSFIGKTVVLKPYTRQDSKRYIDDFFNYPAEFVSFTGGETSCGALYGITTPDDLVFSIYSKDSMENVGTIKLIKYHESLYHVEYYVFKNERKKGYCLDAISTLISALKDKKIIVRKETLCEGTNENTAIDCKALIAIIEKDNIGSNKIAQKAMFKQVDADDIKNYKFIKQEQKEKCNVYICDKL